MRPALRLAISSVSQRPSRAVLLVAVVTLSAALISAVASAFASLNTALEQRVGAMVGDADLIIQPAGRGQFVSAQLLQAVSAWPETASASGAFEHPLPIRATRAVWVRDGDSYLRKAATVTVSATAAAASSENPPRGIKLLRGRWPSAPDEIVLDTTALDVLNNPESKRRPIPPVWTLAAPAPEAPALSGPERVADADEARRLAEDARVDDGSIAEAIRLNGPPLPVRVVGVAGAPPLGGRAQAYLTLEGVRSLSNASDQFTRIDIRLVENADAEAVAAARAAELPAAAVARPAGRVTSGMDRNMRNSQLGLVLASVMAFLAATFIIVTGLTTGVSERQRELAILRCIGARRVQIVEQQLLVGAAIGVAGACLGTPLGILAAWALIFALRDYVPAGLQVSLLGVSLACTGAVLAGLGGSAIPAFLAARVTPLRALSPRAARVSPRTILAITSLGLALLAAQLVIVGSPDDGQKVFWGYATFGLPAMFLGYFLLGVPTVLIATRLLGRAISLLLRIPGRVLPQSAAAMPYRNGFTAGAMMSGLAMLVALWTHGTSLIRDFVDKLTFPEAFVVGVNLSPQSKSAVDAMPFVHRSCAITLHRVDPADSFGVRALQRFQTTFLAFEPDAFFDMSSLQWVEGDLETARERLRRGGAVIVAREFRVAKGLGVGDTFTCRSGDQEHSFEIVGVVSSPGLDIVSKFFAVGDDYAEQAVHSVFGTRQDLVDRFGVSAIHLLQIDLKDPGQPGYVPDEEAIATIRRDLAGAGIIDAGSGRSILDMLRRFATGAMLVSSSIAGFAMGIAALGVANLVIAGIQSRQFEFGVLRAVGARPGLLTRLVLGEAAIVAVAACILGTCMGFQGAYAGRRIDNLLFGLDLQFRPPVLPIICGWAAVILMTLAAAAPAVIALSRRPTRELLANAKG